MYYFINFIIYLFHKPNCSGHPRWKRNLKEKKQNWGNLSISSYATEKEHNYSILEADSQHSLSTWPTPWPRRLLFLMLFCSGGARGAAVGKRWRGHTACHAKGKRVWMLFTVSSAPCNIQESLKGKWSLKICGENDQDWLINKNLLSNSQVPGTVFEP